MISSTDRKYFELAVGTSYIKKITDVDISARCPHCSSDERWKHTSRLHIYANSELTNINCFTGDCPVKNKTVYGYLAEYHPSLLEGYKRETFKTQLNNLGNKDESKSIFERIAEKQNKLESKPNKSPINFFDLTDYFVELNDDSEALDYVKSRGFDPQLLQEKTGKWYFGHSDLKIDDKIYKLTNNVIIPLYGYDENGIKCMYGFYSRNIFEKEFYTFNMDSNFGYKVWNWFNVDHSKPIYVFEGIFDAISFAVSSGNWNIIATMGSNLVKARLSEMKPDDVFCLDDDKSGLTNMLKLVPNGFKFYIQPKQISGKDMNEMFQLGLDCGSIINQNIYQGVRAEIEIKSKL